MSEQMMAEHPDLLGLLRGELTNAESLMVAGHLETCPSCGDELREVALGHSLLTGAGRTLTRSRTRPESAAAEPREIPALPDAPPLDKSIVRNKPRRFAGPTLMLAAAAILVAGTAGVTRAVVKPDETPLAVEKTAALQPVDDAVAAGGKVQMAKENDGIVEMTIDTKELPALPEGEYYYAWLLDPETNKMLGLGQLDPGGKADFQLPVKVVSKYSNIDISLEYDDGNPEHSPTSVLRAEYT
ncbi:MAG: anti-sigma factor [Nocardioides sp.]